MIISRPVIVGNGIQYYYLRSVKGTLEIFYKYICIFTRSPESRLDIENQKQTIYINIRFLIFQDKMKLRIYIKPYNSVMFYKFSIFHFTVKFTIKKIIISNLLIMFGKNYVCTIFMWNFQFFSEEIQKVQDTLGEM